MWAYPEIRTLGELPLYHARHDPDRIALKEGRRTISFAELDETAGRVANGLMSAGIDRHDRVGFIGKNSADFYSALFGTAKTCATFVPLNWRLSVPELAEIIRDSGVRFVFVEAEFAECLTQAKAQAGTDFAEQAFNASASLEEWAGSFPNDRLAHFVSEEDAAIQMYTSGTTGKPKGVLLTHGGFNRMRLCEHLEPAYQWEDGDSFVCALPNFHLLHIGIAVQCLYNGVSITIVRQFDPAAVLASISRDRPSLLTLTPTMIQMLLDHPDAEGTDFSSLRLTLYAGSAISLGLIKRAIAKMPCRFMQFYGTTEANGAFSILRPDEHDLGDERKLQSCGRPLPLIEFRILDLEGNPVADGEPGELVVRAPAIAAGYWRKPDETAASFVDGWYRTGDVARRDEEGLYYIVDRVKDMIVTGGENVYSAEVENVISTHPSVGAVAVIGVPDARWGEAVKAIVVPNGDCDTGDVIAWCRERLAAYKVPKSIDLATEMPLTGTGKISKKDLRAPYWEGVERSVG